MQENNSRVYVGIDVSKQTLDVYILPKDKYLQIDNTPAGIKKLMEKLKKFSPALVVLEATGGYEKEVSYGLEENGFALSVVNPRRIRDFARSIGELAKTDKIDAKVIAQFASLLKPEPTQLHTPMQRTLSENNSRRRQLRDMIQMEKNRLERASKNSRESIERVLDTLTDELENLDKVQDDLIKNDEELNEKRKIMESVAGVGPVTAAALLSELPELGHLDKRQISALAGLAPYARESGLRKGKRSIWGGRSSARQALYMPALTASKYNPAIKAFYERLIAAGKPKKSAITACMHKLLIILNTLLKKKELWQDNFKTA